MKTPTAIIIAAAIVGATVILDGYMDRRHASTGCGGDLDDEQVAESRQLVGNDQSSVIEAREVVLVMPYVPAGKHPEIETIALELSKSIAKQLATHTTVIEVNVGELNELFAEGEDPHSVLARFGASIGIEGAVYDADGGYRIVSQWLDADSQISSTEHLVEYGAYDHVITNTVRNTLQQIAAR